MQLHSAAEGHEHEESTNGYSSWSSSTGNVSDDPSSVHIHSHDHRWPSQAYHCAFCPRVFRTAQALGGHMNIHRRERACANDMGTHIYDCSDSTAICSTTILSRSGHLPASVVDHRSPLFGDIHRLLLNRTPPASINSMASSIFCMEKCYASRGVASKPPVPNNNLASENFAPVPWQMKFPIENEARDGWNGDSKLRVAKLDQSGYINNNTNSDPLCWLFSQLPPPGSATNLQQQTHSPSRCMSNILMQKNLAMKSYHRALAVSKSSAVAVRRSLCCPPPLSTKFIQTRRRSESERSNGEHGAAEECLDLELRL